MYCVGWPMIEFNYTTAIVDNTGDDNDTIDDNTDDDKLVTEVSVPVQYQVIPGVITQASTIIQPIYWRNWVRTECILLSQSPVKLQCMKIVPAKLLSITTHCLCVTG